MQPREIESQICAAVSDVEKRLKNGEIPVSIGDLSADYRDQWARVRLYQSYTLQKLISVAE